MKLQRSTLILILIALGLGGAVYVFEIRESEKQEKIAAKQEQIFTFSSDDVQSFTITTPNQTVAIERIEEENTDSLSPWKMTKPVQTLANPASVNLLINQLVKSQSDPATNTGIRQLKISATDLSKYGLDDPQQVVEVTLKDNQTHRLVFGKYDFTGSSVYGKTDTSSATEEASILVIPNEILTAIEQPLENWKMQEKEDKTVDSHSPNSENNVENKVEIQEEKAD